MAAKKHKGNKELAAKDHKDRKRGMRYGREQTQHEKGASFQFKVFSFQRENWNRGPARLGWTQIEFSRRTKWHPLKIQFAKRLGARTTIPLDWIAARLGMGGRVLSGLAVTAGKG